MWEGQQGKQRWMMAHWAQGGSGDMKWALGTLVERGDTGGRNGAEMFYV